MSKWISPNDMPEWTSEWCWLRVTTEHRQYVYHKPVLIEHLGEHGVYKDERQLFPDKYSIMIIDRPEP